MGLPFPSTPRVTPFVPALVRLLAFEPPEAEPEVLLVRDFAVDPVLVPDEPVRRSALLLDEGGGGGGELVFDPPPLLEPELDPPQPDEEEDPLDELDPDSVRGTA